MLHPPPPDHYSSKGMNRNGSCTAHWELHSQQLPT